VLFNRRKKLPLTIDPNDLAAIAHEKEVLAREEQESRANVKRKSWPARSKSLVQMKKRVFLQRLVSKNPHLSHFEVFVRPEETLQLRGSPLGILDLLMMRTWRNLRKIEI